MSILYGPGANVACQMHPTVHWPGSEAVQEVFSNGKDDGPLTHDAGLRCSPGD